VKSADVKVDIALNAANMKIAVDLPNGPAASRAEKGPENPKWMEIEHR